MLGMNYGPAGDPLALLEDRRAANLSVYARHRDYHDVVKGKLKQLGGWLVAQGGAATAVKVFVDTAPVMEKPLAQAAGLGWQGKHTNLVSRGFGSWLFLGSVFTTLDLPPDAAEPDRCGSCRACLDACPTGAFPAPYQLDARRCISYLTIEHRGTSRPRSAARSATASTAATIASPSAPGTSGRRRRARPSCRRAPTWRRPALADWLALDDAGFRRCSPAAP